VNRTASDIPAALRALPAVDALLGEAAARRLMASWGRPLVRDALRSALAAARASIRDGEPAPSTSGLLDDAEARLLRSAGRGPVAVFNLTGTVLHTNLGRAPLPRDAIAAVAEAAGACALEYDLVGGRRGDRDAQVEALLCALTGAEAALVVNNNAAALMLALNALAAGGEVPISRGELVEIGGSFRMPEIMASAGVQLVEVGTTNRTHPADYERAVGERTGALLKVHPSNYAVEGFTREVDITTLHAIAERHRLPLIYDLGSGALLDLAALGLQREPTPQAALRAGADLVTFSGDKLLGGPQAGVMLGRAALIERLRTNPLRRALRLDKLTLAALTAVLRLYGDETGERALPVRRLLARPAHAIRAQAERVAPEMQRMLGEAWRVEVAPLSSQIGSGALPVASLPSAGLALRPVVGSDVGERLSALAARLRALRKPVIGRIQDGALLLDLRCLEEAHEAAFVDQLQALTAS